MGANLVESLMSSTFTKIELGKWMDTPFAFCPIRRKWDVWATNRFFLW